MKTITTLTFTLTCPCGHENEWNFREKYKLAPMSLDCRNCGMRNVFRGTELAPFYEAGALKEKQVFYCECNAHRGNPVELEDMEVIT